MTGINKVVPLEHGWEIMIEKWEKEIKKRDDKIEMLEKENRWIKKRITEQERR